MLDQVSPSICLKSCFPFPSVRLISSFAIFPPWDCTQRNGISATKEKAADSASLNQDAQACTRVPSHTLSNSRHVIRRGVLNVRGGGGTSSYRSLSSGSVWDSVIEWVAIND